jgi:hypothetical protein
MRIFVSKMQVSETMAQSNGVVNSNGACDDNKPMLIMKKSIDSQGNGLTALINKQLQGEARVKPTSDICFGF